MAYQLSLETIHFQKDGFGKLLENWVASFRPHVPTVIDQKQVYVPLKEIDNYKKQLRALLQSRFGIMTEIELFSEEVAAVMPLYITKAHTFLDTMTRHMASKDNVFDQVDDQKDFESLLKNNNAIGWVDNKQAKVGGVFSKQPFRLYFNFTVMIHYEKLTDAEITAVILHEVGHIFSILEYSDRLNTTNRYIQDIRDELNKNNDPGRVSYILKELDRRSGKKYSFQELEKENNRIIFGFKLYHKTILYTQSLMPNSVYDRTTTEQQADQFSSRFGYGRHLITGLDKISSWRLSERSLGWQGFFLLLEFIYHVLRISILAYSIMRSLSNGDIGSAVKFTLFSLVYFFVTIFGERGESNREYTYDDMKIRYQRIRNDMVEMVKRVELSKQELKDILVSIDQMDKIIKSRHQYRSLSDMVSNILVPANRAAVRDINDQQTLELLVSNDLFLKSAQFKTL